MLTINSYYPSTLTNLSTRRLSIISSRFLLKKPNCYIKQEVKNMTKTAAKATKSALVPIGEGSEEIEAVTIIDVLRRAGANVEVASVESSREVLCSRGVRIVADCLIDDVKDKEFDLIALPGGAKGSEQLRDSVPLDGMLKKQLDSGRLLGAICAAPYTVLETKGLLKGRKATAYPGISSQLENQSAVNSRVVLDDNLVTSRGPGTAFEFSLALVSHLFGEKKASQVAEALILPPASQL
uniref:DJ-1/PfpI domain-containing protein n=1 Tax=Polytomella parva TaxID=51329 RepID=A0A7S0YN02_9CHLO|mmetsp:Transcript_29215/g.53670  ORF Transcript_29215/g.53670 Transcript_29215/m.53670 type:complete len:239 (+) Transcript_29215:29-745(+)